MKHTAITILKQPGTDEWLLKEQPLFLNSGKLQDLEIILTIPCSRAGSFCISASILLLFQLLLVHICIDSIDLDQTS
jgi:hypothetical protein